MLWRKLLRTAWKYKAQFISMIIMIAIGMGIFMGFNAEWYSMEIDSNLFFEQTCYADYRLYHDQGFSEEDIDAVKKIDRVNQASRFFSVNVGLSGGDQSLALTVVEDYTVSTMLITSGKKYDQTSEGIWLSDQFAKANHFEIGDLLTVVYRNVEISAEIVGLCKSSEYMICTADENQLMPDFKSFGFAYVSPETVKSAMNGFMIYPQINIISDLDKETLQSEVNAVLGKTTLLIEKDLHKSYAGVSGEIEEGKTMASVLPVLFLAIAILTMITTMHRICVSEKTQIGTLKALGFQNGKIIRHFTAYGLFLGAVGSLLGIGLGYGIAAIIVNPDGMMGTYLDMPDWSLHMPYYCWIIIFAVIAFLTFISFLSVRSLLRGTAADALRPYTPKKVKPLPGEKTKAWNRLSFGTRWNIRDLMRHKSRSVMTLIGVIGCTILLVGGLGMKDTMTGFLSTIDRDIYQYETRVNFTETVTAEQAEDFAAAYNADILYSLSGEADGETRLLDIYTVDNVKIGFLDTEGKQSELSNSGAYVCMRLSDQYPVGSTVVFSPYGSDRVYNIKVAGVLRSVVTENITMTREYAESIGMECGYSAAFTDVLSTDIQMQNYISGMQSKAKIMESYDSFMDVMNTMVLLLALAAVILGIVVLYNLGVMSYTERYRELATLKVVGFQNKRIGGLLISQNMWLTVIGVIFGIPAGVGVLHLLIALLATEYELKIMLGALTYCVSILVTFGMSLLVGGLIAIKNRKINMVEALKGAE